MEHIEDEGRVEGEHHGKQDSEVRLAIDFESFMSYNKSQIFSWCRT